jgi:O-antigen/teichoic acid export membrane protein
MPEFPSNTTARFGNNRDLGLLTTNAASLLIVACSGILINSILAFGFGVATVGQFNQLFTLYFIAAQFAAFGIHLSCLHYLSGENPDFSFVAKGATTALIAVSISGILSALLLYSLADLIEWLLNSAHLSDGLRWAAPAVALFGFNKVLLAVLNATERLHSVAFLQAFRSIVWLAGAAVLLHIGSAEPILLGQLLLSGEMASAIFGTLILYPVLFFQIEPRIRNEWIARHFRFGLRAMPSNFITDLNSRIDVLLVSVFANDSAVGVYSFASLLAEGVLQIGVIVRTVINSRLVVILISKNQAALLMLRRHAGRLSFLFTLVASTIIALCFAPAIELLQLDPSLRDGESALIILLIGVTLSSKFWPFWMILLLAGHPVQHLKLMLLLCFVNIILNATLIPLFGILGAGIATAVMLVSFPFMLSWSTRRVLGMVL